MNRQSIEIERILQPNSQDDQNIQMQKCEAFSRNIVTKILKPFIEQQLIPKITEIVDIYIS